MRKYVLLMVALSIIAMAGTTFAQNERLKLHFDFSDVSGTQVKDNASGITAKTVGVAKVMKMGAYNVLDLGNNTGYLDMTAQAGQVVRSLEDFTVSVYYRVNDAASLSGAGHFLWCFSQSAANTQTSAPYAAYRLNAQRMATSTGGWGSEVGLEVGSESSKGQWMHMLYRQTGQKGELYINGTRAKQATNMPLLKNAFTAAPAYNWIGRPPFSGDSYLKQTLVADFRLYDVAISDELLAQLAAETTNLDEAYANGGGGNNANLLSAIREAESLLSNTTDYPEAAVTMLSDMVVVCRAISQQDCNQDVYDQYTTDLRAAVTSFKKSKNFVFDMGYDVGIYDTNRGFIHPGGLHTEADFERIRQQLAAGNAKVKEAYQRLKNAEYAQANVQTWPVETIVRGGGSGENYINAARGATMAYQNALRWKIEGTKANADAAVRILMAWARTCKLVSGDSNWALAAGLYGYEFAQAAELMRDYDGWSREDFEEFKHWMLTVWYPGNINFLRGRNGTWDNPGGWGDCPGHYWSNWPLCNVLSLMTIGVLCDDVFIYNQGMSFMKYDQVGTFRDPRTANPILNDGLTEFIGNLVVTTAEWEGETGAYGKVGQMQESGRDVGHAAMALGLAVDICHMAWNQGDDLFSYMDNRMAAGIEYVAACMQGASGLPWTNYHYADKGIAWWDSRAWLQTSYATGQQIRNYWGTVIGHYEGVKGVKMPFAEKAYQQMGIDAGGTGGTSGSYDHLGYSVLMNTRDEQLCPEEKRPTLLTPRMEYDGKVLEHNELGGLRNTYVVQSTQCLPAGKLVKLMPQLPEGEEDTGQWQWNTGQTTKDITVMTDHSYVYRATYTNANGIQSQQAFTLAVEGDCTPSPVLPGIYVGDTWVGDTVATVFYGEKVTLTASDAAGWYPEVRWDDGSTGSRLTLGAVASERVVRAYVVSQGGRKQPINYHIHLKYMQPRITRNGSLMEDQTMLVAAAGDKLTLQLYVPKTVGEVSYLWSDGSTKSTLTIPSVESSGIYTVQVGFAGRTETVSFEVFIKDTDSAILPQGLYMMKHVASNTFMTANGDMQLVTFQPGDTQQPDARQVWSVETTSTRHSFTTLADSTSLNTIGKTASVAIRTFLLDRAKGLDRYALHTGTGTSAKYWTVDADGSFLIQQQAAPTDFPYELILVKGPSGITRQTVSAADGIYTDLQGRRLAAEPRNGLYIKNGEKHIR